MTALLPVLVSFLSTAHRQAASALQTSLSEFESLLTEQIESLYGWREEEWKAELIAENQERDRGDYVEKGKVEEGRERIERPKVSKSKWKIGMLEI